MFLHFLGDAALPRKPIDHQNGECGTVAAFGYWPNSPEVIRIISECAKLVGNVTMRYLAKYMYDFRQCSAIYTYT